MYLGQSARRVFAPSEAGKQKSRERSGHLQQTKRTRTQIRKNLRPGQARERT